jgi:hypothetical protein
VNYEARSGKSKNTRYESGTAYNNVTGKCLEEDYNINLSMAAVAAKEDLRAISQRVSYSFGMTPS